METPHTYRYGTVPMTVLRHIFISSTQVFENLETMLIKLNSEEMNE